MIQHNVCLRWQCCMGEDGISLCGQCCHVWTMQLAYADSTVGLQYSKKHKNLRNRRDLSSLNNNTWRLYVPEQSNEGGRWPSFCVWTTQLAYAASTMGMQYSKKHKNLQNRRDLSSLNNSTWRLYVPEWSKARQGGWPVTFYRDILQELDDGMSESRHCPVTQEHGSAVLLIREGA